MEALTKIVVTLSLAVAAFGQPPAVPGWKLSIGELRKQYNHYGVGRRLKPVVWPNNSRVAVALSFDSENATAALAKGEFGSSAMSRGMYGSIDGLPRILNMLDRRNVPASFFIPAVCALLNPEMIPLILSKKRHEIGVHGWIHENPATLNDAAEESRLLKQAIAVLTKAMGKRPAGYRAPSWAMSPYTMGLVREAGFLYDSSLMASDGAYEVTIDGRSSGVIELPIEGILDDYPYFGAADGSLPSPELVDRIYRAEFDVAYQEGGLFILTMHPHITGHRSRVLWLERLIEYMKSKPGVWFATLEEAARYVKEHSGK